MMTARRSRQRVTFSTVTSMSNRRTGAIFVGMLHHFEPVQIWERPGASRAIGDVERAAEWLLFHWPDEQVDTLQHRAARLACLKAYEGKVPPEYARAAFVVAAREANILVTS